jgi:sucrose-6-phosphate hydrolase SacC (GH32 family)
MLLRATVVALATGNALADETQCAFQDKNNFPRYHIQGQFHHANDICAIFRWGDLWHIMKQGSQSHYADHGVGWEHHVSSDLATWTILPNAVEGPNACVHPINDHAVR